jgi:hypothetical protein
MLYVGISRASKTLHTVRVPANLRLNRAEVNAAYRSARAAYEDVAGESYLKVLRYLGIETGSVMGKHVATGVLVGAGGRLTTGGGLSHEKRTQSRDFNSGSRPAPTVLRSTDRGR